MEPLDQDRWVEDRLEKLSPPENWAPDAATALARFRQRQNARSGSARRWLYGTVATAALGATAAAFPLTRVYAQRCVDACVAQTRFVRASLVSRLRSERFPAARPAAPDFVLQDSTGNPVRLSEYRGKVVLLNFWATWCRPCSVEIPWFMAFQQQYPGMTVLGVAMDDDGWTSVRPFMDAKAINYPIALGNDDVMRGFGAVDSLPATVLIDKAGRIAAVHVGLVEKKIYEADIKALLAEP